MRLIGNILGFIIAFVIYLIEIILSPLLKFVGIKETRKISYPQFKKITKEESFKKGEEFEQYVRDHLFTKEKYVIVERTHNYETNSKDFVESTLKPDFKFRNVGTKSEFYVEAKWRQNLYNNALKWSYEAQLERYKNYSKEYPFYVVIGLGGTPNKPDNVYLGRIDEIDDIKIYKDELNQYKYIEQAKRYKLN
jgi:hypothetical protein